MIMDSEIIHFICGQPAKIRKQIIKYFYLNR